MRKPTILAVFALLLLATYLNRSLDSLSDKKIISLGWFTPPVAAQEGEPPAADPTSASSTAEQVDAAIKALPERGEDRGGAAVASVPVVLQRSTQFQTSDGNPAILDAGNYLVEVTAGPPLRVQSEVGNQTWTLTAKSGTHKEKLTAPEAESVAGPNPDEHHFVLLLPSGKSADAAGTYSGVAKRALAPVSASVIAKSRGKAKSAVQSGLRIPSKDPVDQEAPQATATIKARVVEERPARATFYQGLFRDRIIVKFKEGAVVRLGQSASRDTKPSFRSMPPAQDAESKARMQRGNVTQSKVQTDLAKVNEILKRQAVKQIAPLFSRQEKLLQADRIAAERLTAQEQADLSNYFTIQLEPDTKGEELVDEFNGLASVETAYLAPVPVDAQADIAPPTPTLQANQGYVAPAPQGIDAQFAWTLLGGRGNGIRVIDIEGSWYLQHEDLPPPFFTNGSIGTSSDHGTAVLGEMVSNNGSYGVTGIASGGAYGVVSVIRPTGGYSVADAVNVAASRLSRGDVILIEQHAKGPASGQQCTCNCGQFEYIAMEYWQAEFDAIQAATARGIHVVEAAGNGSMNLDDARYGNRFNRNTRDSGAIIVGASDGNLRPTCWTNRGSRVDVHGWGQGVWSTGYGVPDPQNRINGADRRQWYTNQFSGTSSASPIVTGAVMSLMGIRRAAGIEGMPAIQLRTLLRNTGTPQQNTNAGQIGPLPNLRNAVSQMPLQDCLGLNPNNVSAQRIQNRWKVVDGNHWLLDFANDQAAAVRARNTIRHYGLNKICFIGRPDPSMSYWLVNNQVPTGAFSGEDCISVNPNGMQVQQVSGRWKIVQGNMWVLDFEDKEHEARASLNVIQKYGFTRQCFVKRPNPPMSYWRR